MPIKPGSRWVYRETDTEGTRQKVVVTVTDRTKLIANGVTARVVRDIVTEKGALVEDTVDWYAQDRRGNVWYLGEDTKDYENGKLVSTEGSFEAGVDGARPGIVMLANPRPGMQYRQEHYNGHAEDKARVLSRDEQAEVPAGHYRRLLMTKDLNPLEPKVLEFKLYAKGVGLVLARGRVGRQRARGADPLQEGLSVRARSASSSSRRASGSSSVVAEQLAQAGQAVAGRLRVQVERPGHRCGVALLLHVRERGLLHAPARLRAQVVERGEPPRRDPRNEPAILEEQQLGERVVHPHQARLPSSAPASIACKAARASDHERASAEIGAAGPSATRRVTDGTLDLAAAARALGVGDHEAADSVERRRERLGRQAARRAGRARPRRRRAWLPARHAPVRGRGRRAQVVLVGRRVAQQQRHEVAPPPAPLALELRARLGVALHRVGRELLDVGEDRLGQQAEHLRVDVRAAGRPAIRRHATRAPTR